MNPEKRKQIKMIALVNPYYQRRTKSIAQITVGPPLGLAYIASVLESNGYDVAIIDANAEQLPVKEIVRRVFQFKADIAGLSAVTATVHACHQIASELKKLDNSIVTIIGGVHATALPEETLKDFVCFDFLIKGEGEYVFAELLNALNNADSLTQVKGIGYRSNSDLVINERRDNIQDLDALPFPARHLLNKRLYRTFDSDRMTSVIAIRGCPAKCVYCAVNQVSGTRCRKRSPENVTEEIAACFSEYNARFIAFLDDTFTFDKAWAHKLCDELVKSGINKRMKWSCLTRVDNVDYSLLLHMKKAGCIRVEFGIESGSQELLNKLKKGITIGQIKEAFSLAKKLKLSTMGFVMLNAPGETRETIAETEKLIMEVEPDFLQVSFATPYPGTELFEACEKEGLLMTKDWSQYIFLNHQIIRNKDIKESELKKLKQRIEESFYLRLKYLFRMLVYMLKSPQRLKTMLWSGANALKVLFFRK